MATRTVTDDDHLRRPGVRRACALAAMIATLVTVAAGSPAAAAVAVPKRCGVPAYRFPADQYPFRDRCLDLGYGDYHYFDERPRGRIRGTVLMVHGNPTSSFVYRDVAKDLLATGYRVIAMDHYGFGESAKPSPDRFGYRPSDHTRMLVRFVDALHLRRVTLLVQDWGGPIGLGMAEQRPNRIKDILVMDTWAWQVSPRDHGGVFGPLADWSATANRDAATYTADGLVVFGAAQLLASQYPQPLSGEVLAAYRGPFFDPDGDRLRSPTVAVPTVRFAQSIFQDTAMFRTIGTLKTIRDKPVGFYYGAQDPLFGALRPDPDGRCAKGTASQTTCVDARGHAVYPFIDRFRSEWNPSKVRFAKVNDKANHFIQQQAPAQVARLVGTLNR